MELWIQEVGPAALLLQSLRSASALNHCQLSNVSIQATTEYKLLSNMDTICALFPGYQRDMLLVYSSLTCHRLVREQTRHQPASLHSLLLLLRDLHICGHCLYHLNAWWHGILH